MDKVKALLLVDIVGSTELTERLGEPAASKLWLQHDRLARDMFRALGGVEIDKTDGFLLLFESAVNAAQFAGRYGECILTLEPSMRARGAMHVAHMSTRSTPQTDVAQGAKPIDVDGLLKAIVARVISIAAAGQTLLTQPAAEELQLSCLKTAGVGHWRMKGLKEPLALFELVLSDESTDGPVNNEKAYRVAQRGDAWVPLQELAHSLPFELASFVGRRRLLLAVQQGLEGGARLVTLHGPGGIGKTRLAIRAAWSQLGAYAGGVWFCDLSAASSIDGILHAVASGLRLPPTENTDPLRTIRDALVGRGHCLLVLDNFEQVANHAPVTLGRWLAETVDAHFLVTSRAALKVPGEVLYGLDSLSETEALRLLSVRGQSVRADFTISPLEHVQARRLVELLDCLPLAIELAASRLSALSLDQILERMSQRFRLLAGAKGDERHSALRRTLEWSWDLLAESERHAFAAVSVFEAGFTLQAFEAVIGKSAPNSEIWPLDLLQALVDKSLLRRLPIGRYEMLYSIREFAAERLGDFEPEGRTAVHHLHAAYFGSLDPATSRRIAVEEIENVVVAARWAWHEGHVALLVKLLDLAWLGLQNVGPFRVAISLAEPVIQHHENARELDAMARYVAGSARKMMGDAALAEQHLQAAVALSVQDGSPRVRILALCALYDCLVDRGEITAAFVHIEIAESLAEERSIDELKLLCMNSKAAYFHQVGDLRKAWTLYQSALALARHIDDKRWQGGILGNLGNVCQAQGDLEHAADLYRQALQLSVLERDRRWAVNTKCNLGLVQCELGRSDDALTLLQIALTEADAIGSVYASAIIECNLGIVETIRGLALEAATWFERFHERAQTLGNRALLASAKGYLATATARLGAKTRAELLMDEALRDSGALDPSGKVILAAQRAELAFLQRSTNADRLMMEAEEMAGSGHLAFEVANALSAARLSPRVSRIQR